MAGAGWCGRCHSEQRLSRLDDRFFLLELRKIPYLILAFDPVRKSLKMDFGEDFLIVPPKLDWAAKATPGHDKFPECNRRMHLTFALDGGDSLMKDKPDVLGDYITPAGSELGSDAVGFAKATFNLSTFFTDAVTGLPYAKQTGLTSLFNQLNVNAAPRLLFWQGLTGGLPKALPEADGISLYLTVANGLAAKSWKRTSRCARKCFILRKALCSAKRIWPCWISQSWCIIMG